ncbi:hypothetical protein V8E55_001308 [Tylopilus felleus]
MSRYLPMNAWAWKAVGVVELMHRNSVQSIETFQVALYTEPEDQLLWIHLGEAYSRAGHHTAALKALTKHQLKHHDPLYEAWKEEKDEDEHGSDDGCAHLFATDNVNVKLPPVPPRMLYIEIVGALLVSSWWLTHLRALQAHKAYLCGNLDDYQKK